MVLNFFKVALRIMVRNRLFSSINIIGLALGMTGAMLLLLWVHHEFSYDQFHEKKDRLYVAWNREGKNGQFDSWAVTPRVLAPTLKQNYAFVEQSASVATWGVQHLFTVGENRVMKTSGIFADSTFLTMFSFPLIKGNSVKALNGPTSIVITEEFARQLFGDHPAFNETLSISQSGYTFEFQVTGILKSLPTNTEFRFDYILPYSFVESLDGKDTFWGNNSVATYVLLQDGVTLEDANTSVKDVVRKHYGDAKYIDLFLHPFTRMRLHSGFENGVESGGRIEVVNMLTVLAIALLVIAGINFVNLSTARSQRRAKEVAVRKVTGAVRTSLVFQFLCESILVAVAAGILSIVGVVLLLPTFNTLVGETLIFPGTSILFWMIVAGCILTIGFLAGGYPSLYLSAFRPIRIMRGFQAGSAKSVLRSTLVVVQFGLAMLLIVSAFVIREQITYVQNRNSGYSQTQLIHIPLSGDMSKNYQSFVNEVKQEQIATSVTKTSAPVTQQWSNSSGIGWRGKDPEDRRTVERIYTDEEPIKTLGLTLLQGRDIDLNKFPTDSSAVVVNETAAQMMGFENPINEEVDDDSRKYHIVGVVKDFVFKSPYREIEPIMLFGAKAKWAFNVIYLKLSPNHTVQQHLDKLSKLVAKYNPAYPFEYEFADLEYARKFDDLRRILLITTIFTCSTIAIACLGLLGLAIYMTEARVKEIGIRKVLGGSVVNITRLLSANALKPILIAVVAAIPIVWFILERWLQSFNYRVSFSIWTFVVPSLIIVGIALFTISTQTVRVAMGNPMESLKNE